ncbi:MAG: hypothetical protein AAGK69_06900, partial [Pseudomonadota bacterium]
TRAMLKAQAKWDVLARIGTAMAGIGAATNQRMADMLEAHEDQMVFARDVLEQKAKADERFARRFADIVEKHDANAYGG